MDRPSVYIETTIVSYLAARPSRDLVVASHQWATRQWWEHDRTRFRLVTSQLVLDRVAGDAALVEAWPELLRDVSVVETTAEAARLADRLLSDGLLPATADAEALHIALAAVHGVEYLLTWDCTHIANASKQRVLRTVCQDEGYPSPVICTPEHLSTTTEGAWTDPIVEEVHRVRREYAARFGHDIEAIFQDIRQKQEEAKKSGNAIISTPLRPPVEPFV